MGKIDYSFKSFILNQCSDLLSYVNKCKRYQYIKYQEQENGLLLKMPYSDKELVTISDLKMRFYDYGKVQYINECLKILHANYERTKRLNDRIKAIISSNKATFITLTFTDKALSETSAKTRRQAVTRYLKQFNAPYVANIDFGVDESKTMREHYHAVIGSQQLDYTTWNYGIINGEKIHVKNTKALAKYVSKLSNHAIKEQAKRSSLIYSR